MISGQKPKPLALHVVNGTLGKMNKARRAKHERSPAPKLGVGTPPSTFTEDQLAVWTRLVEDAPEGLLTKLDRDIFVNYVLLIVARDRAMKLYIESGCQVLIRTTDGSGRLASNPVMRELRRVLEQLRPLQAELGFTPMSRSRIQLAERKEEEDELAGFLGPK